MNASGLEIVDLLEVQSALYHVKPSFPRGLLRCGDASTELLGEP